MDTQDLSKISSKNNKKQIIITCSVIFIILVLCCTSSAIFFLSIFDNEFKTAKKSLEGTICVAKSDLPDIYKNKTTDQFKRLYTEEEFLDEVSKVSSDCSKVLEGSWLTLADRNFSVRNGILETDSSQVSLDMNGKRVNLVFNNDKSDQKLDNLTIK